MEVSTDKRGSSDRKELSTSSGTRPGSNFTQSLAALQPTSLEQVQATAQLSFLGIWEQLIACMLLQNHSCNSPSNLSVMFRLSESCLQSLNCVIILLLITVGGGRGQG